MKVKLRREVRARDRTWGATHVQRPLNVLGLNEDLVDVRGDENREGDKIQWSNTEVCEGDREGMASRRQRETQKREMSQSQMVRFQKEKNDQDQ